MNKIQKKVNTYINSSILVSLGFFVLGIVFLAMPSLSLDIIRWVIAIGSLILGMILVAADFGKRRTFPFFSTAVVGIVLLIIGLIFIRHPHVMDIFPIILGAIFIVSAFASGRLTAALRGTNAGIYATITTILAIICGILLIANPWEGNISMMIFAGIMMIIYSLSTFIDMIVLKKNVKELTKELKNFFKGE
ncbi:DUF308 domain-containing protein [Candidatus Saccharibacteria bacterium]|nr:DUF308 domain-containing protein [Candidatus Saccharibacteria bacterium]